MIKDALYAVTHGQDLSYDLAKDTMNKIMSGEVAEVPMAGFLCALAAKGPTVDEVTAFAEVMREKAGSVPHEGTVVEIVGTGGDEANTFNISTTSGYRSKKEAMRAIFCASSIMATPCRACKATIVLHF